MKKTKTQETIEKVCSQKIDRLRELSKKPLGHKFLHHSTLSGYIGSSSQFAKERLYKIAEMGLVPSRKLNGNREQTIWNREQDYISLSPDFQPVFQIEGHAKATYIIDPDVLGDENGLQRSAESFLTGSYLNKMLFGLDLCEKFESCVTEIIDPKYILGVIIRDNRDSQIAWNTYNYQRMNESGKKDLLSKLSPNSKFISVFEDKPENAFPVFINGMDYRAIDPRSGVKVKDDFVNLEKMLSNRIFPYDSRDCPAIGGSFKSLVWKEKELNGELKSRANSHFDLDGLKVEIKQGFKDAKKIGKSLGFTIEGDYIKEEDLRSMEIHGFPEEKNDEIVDFLSKLREISNFGETVARINSIASKVNEDVHNKYFKKMCFSSSDNKRMYLGFMRSKISKENFEEYKNIKIPNKFLELKERFTKNYKSGI